MFEARDSFLPFGLPAFLKTTLETCPPCTYFLHYPVVKMLPSLIISFYTTIVSSQNIGRNFFTKKFEEESPLVLYIGHWHNVSCRPATRQPIRPIQTAGAPQPSTSIERAAMFLPASLSVSERVRDIFFLLKISSSTWQQFNASMPLKFNAP